MRLTETDMQDMTPDEIDHFLDDARNGRLCMAGADGRPYTIPLPFCWAGGALYVRLPLTGRKGMVLRENDRVCFEADDFTDSLDDYTSVIVEGRLVEVTDLEEKRRVKQANDEKYRRLRGGHRPGHGRAKPLQELPLRKLVVEQVGGRRKGQEVAAAMAAAGTDGAKQQPW
jgi:nitroimidazol reductase NimA-like FMN-containing flavoprotein (pyridoxamine 5'-phosphate oxidase superfamily)